MRGIRRAERSEWVDYRQSTPSREEQVKKDERRKILDRLNSIDTGVSWYDREPEERSARELALAREKERRSHPGC